MARPLQKHRRDGSLYVRRPAVEQACDLAAQQSLATALSRAAIADRDAADYLPTECLLYLTREARRLNDDPGFNALVRSLVMRCVVMVRAGVSERLLYADDARNEIIDELMELIAIDGSPEDKNRLDYFEVNFDHGFQTLRINVVRAHRARAKHEIPAEDPAAGVMVTDDDDALVTEEQIALLEERLEMLTQQERTAIALHYLQGIEIESKEPTKTTVATLMRVSGRTVRTIIRRAKQELLTLEMNP